jgi:phosphopantothenoylcysteine synthetase/decarboxylase
VRPFDRQRILLGVTGGIASYKAALADSLALSRNESRRTLADAGLDVIVADGIPDRFEVPRHGR